MQQASLGLPPVDFSRYPLDGSDEAALADLIASCRRHLDTDQYFSLPGFVHEHAIVDMAREAEALLDLANRAQSRRNCYLQQQGDPALAAEHPRNRFFSASYRMLAADCFPESSALKRLYHWTPFREMIAAIAGFELFPSADTLQPVNVICYGDGDQSAWHYDSSNAFTMTLMLQSAAHGGEFELAPNTRNGEDDEDLDYMNDVLCGRSQRVQTVSRQPGELTVFRGNNSLHRVSPVSGNRLRMMAVIVYEGRPGVVGDPEVNLTVYGRTGRPG